MLSNEEKQKIRELYYRRGICSDTEISRITDITMCNMARTTFYDRASRYEKSIKSK